MTTKISSYRNLKSITAITLAILALCTAIYTDLNNLHKRGDNQVITPAGLVIKSAYSPTVKAGTLSAFVADGTLVYKAANTDMPAISGTLAKNKFALWSFYIDSAGTLTASSKTADAASAAAALLLKPAIPAAKAEIGYIIVGSHANQAFTAATSPLETTATTLYFSNVGRGDAPTALTLVP